MQCWEYKNVGRITGREDGHEVGWVSCFGTVYWPPGNRRVQREERLGERKDGQADIGRVLRPRRDKGDGRRSIMMLVQIKTGTI